MTGLGLDIGMRDKIAGDRSFPTNFALSCHGFLLKEWGVFNKWGLKVKKNQALGREGEQIAANYLERQGFQIVAQNFRTRWGELDIVAKKGGEYYFVEVKTRQSLTHGHPTEQLTAYRLQRFQKMTLYYAQKHHLLNQKLHCSLLGIDFSQGNPQISWLRDIID